MKYIPASEVEKLRVVVFRDDVVPGQWLQKKLDALLASAVEPPEPGGGGISHIGECKGEWTCDCGLRMTEAEIVARLTSRPVPDDKLREEARPAGDGFRKSMEDLRDQWRKEIRGEHPENTRQYWEGRATAHNDLDAALRKEGA